MKIGSSKMKHIHDAHTLSTHTRYTYTQEWNNGFLETKLERDRENGYRKMPVSTQAHTKHTKQHTCNHTPTQTHLHTLSLSVSHTHKQERNSNYLEMSPDIACHSQRP